MKVRIVTALFDIKRDTLGDGRSIESYLDWFRLTLKLKCDVTIYTEERFKSFVLECRKDCNYVTDIVIQDLTEVPFYVKRDSIISVFNSNEFKNKMSDLKRIECYLPEYNIIQYSKFGWLKNTLNTNIDIDYVIWMDAGCSRFFGNFNLNNEWPNIDKLNSNKLLIQGNSNFVRLFNNLDIDQYLWDNNCILVGTLFGGGRDIINKLEVDINNIFDLMIDRKCVNNEQFALAFFAKKNLDIVDIKIILDGTHLPIFKFLG